jgi:hypothetical protein
MGKPHFTSMECQYNRYYLISRSFHQLSPRNEFHLAEPSQDADGLNNLSRNFLPFTEHKDSQMCSQQPAIRPYLHITVLQFIFILNSHLCLGLTSYLSSSFPNKMLICISHLPHTSYMLYLFHILLLH